MDKAEGKAGRQLLLRFADALVGMEMHVFVLHADPDFVGLEYAGEFGTGELAALVGIE